MNERKPPPELTPEARGCIMLLLAMPVAVLPSLGVTLLLIGVLQRYVVDSWLISIGAGVLASFPIYTVAVRWITRQFRRTNSHAFYKRSCFILTEAGAAFARQIDADFRASHDLPETSPPASHDGHDFLPRPHWDAELREFSVDGQLVKRFKSPAPNQVAILSAFEEDGWPRHVDDPLPRTGNPEADPKRRLNDTVKSLNRHHYVRVIHFSTDGTGEGVRWELAQHRSASIRK